ncbi:hypothetical protein C8Q78DRAFT_181342 [Trametes maxima]|nr:hypothetical protein C8Q78DRAFT_181342 [Trametes maxima]
MISLLCLPCIGTVYCHCSSFTVYRLWSRYYLIPLPPTKSCLDPFLLCRTIDWVLSLRTLTLLPPFVVLRLPISLVLRRVTGLAIVSLHACFCSTSIPSTVHMLPVFASLHTYAQSHPTHHPGLIYVAQYTSLPSNCQAGLFLVALTRRAWHNSG